MTNFEKALDKLMQIEGFVSEDKSGGYTFCGIARNKHPEWPGWKYIDKKDFTSAEKFVADFYKEEFWDKLKCSDYTNFFVAFNIFQIAVNRGLGISREVQHTCTILKRDLDPEKFIDGKIGRITVGVVNQIEPVKFLEVFLGFSAGFYEDLIKRRPHDEEYIRGWLRKRVYLRIYEVYEYYGIG